VAQPLVYYVLINVSLHVAMPWTFIFCFAVHNGFSVLRVMNGRRLIHVVFRPVRLPAILLLRDNFEASINVLNASKFYVIHIGMHTTLPEFAVLILFA